MSRHPTVHPRARSLPRPRPGRGFFAALAAGLAFGICAPAAAAQTHGGAGGWRVAARAIPLLTHASPAMAGEARTEAYLTQPMLTGSGRLAEGRLELTATLNLEGLTLRRGELNAGIWGEGYVDRRHPHTYLHEAMATARLPVPGRARGSLAAGRGFVPFGTDDPMVRPFVKYPANHHLAQVLERLVAVAALRAGPVVIEAAAFGGGEPSDPGDLGAAGRFGDSWSARLTGYPGPALEAQASYAYVASPEFPAGSGLDHRKRSASLRWEPPRAGDAGAYVLLEWARTDEYAGADRYLGLDTWLAEGALRRGGREAAVRLERTLRPEEERLADPFRVPVPHSDVHVLGLTRWSIATLSLTGDAQRWGPVRARPFVEIGVARVEETTGSPVFDPVDLYGSRRQWSLSLGTRVETGAAHGRMGRYGAALSGAGGPGADAARHHERD